MRLDNLNRCILDEHDGLEMLYQNKPIENALFEKIKININIVNNFFIFFLFF